MKTYINFSDLSYSEKSELWKVLKSSELITFSEFEKMVLNNFNNNLFELLSYFGNVEDDKCIIITSKFKFTEFEFSGTKCVKVEDINEESILITKTEYNRLLQIEKLYKELTNAY